MGGCSGRFEDIDFSTAVGYNVRRNDSVKVQVEGELTLSENAFTGKCGIDGEALLTVPSGKVELKGLWIELVTLTSPPTKGDGACTLLDIRPRNPNVALVGTVWPNYDDPGMPSGYPRGTHRFSFHINLSQANIPPTMWNDLGYIQHSIALVSVSDHKWRILDCKQVTTQSGSLNLAMFPHHLAAASITLRQITSKYETRTTWEHGALSPPSSTGIEATVKLSKQGFLPNDTIQGYIKVENPFRRAVKNIRVQVEMKTTCRQSSPTNSKSRLIARGRIAIADGSSATQFERFSLRLPPEMDPTWVTDDRKMTNQYAIHVKTVDGIELHGAQNITIGTHNERASKLSCAVKLCRVVGAS